jgi:hypothetical protein
VIGERLENKSVWMKLTAGALGPFTLGPGRGMGPRCP